MPSADWEDLDEFLDPDDFAKKVALDTQAGRFFVTGIFDSPYLNAELGEYELDTVRPRFLGKMAELKDARRGDTLTLGDVIYDVMSGAQPDGTGMATLELAARD